MIEPLMCPYCGGAELIEEEETVLETEDAYMVIYHWLCTDCGEGFDKVNSRSHDQAFEDAEDEGPLWS